LASIRPSKNIIPEFLAAYLRSYWGNVQIYRWGNKATRPELNTDEVRQILVPLPPKDIQKLLVTEIEKRRVEAQRLRQEAETEWEAAKTRFERQLLGELDP
jgi:type I restriction enzyme, S subunit